MPSQSTFFLRMADALVYVFAIVSQSSQSFRFALGSARDQCVDSGPFARILPAPYYLPLARYAQSAPSCF